MSLSIELADEVAKHYERVKNLAMEAEDYDSTETLTARAAAMRALTLLMQDLTELEEKTRNLHTLSILEQTLIEFVKENFDEFQFDKFVKTLEERMSKVA